MKARHLLFVAFLVLTFGAAVVVLVAYSVAGVWRFPSVLPETTSLRAFEYVLAQRHEIARGIGGSLLYSATTVATTAVVSVAPARLFARYDFPGRTTIEGLLLAPALVPSITFSIGIQHLFVRAGLTDTFIGVVAILTIFTYPYMLRALAAGFEMYGSDYVVCARNLGAGKLRSLLTIEIPLLLPSLVAGGTVVFLICFSEYFLVFLIGGGAVASFTAYMFAFLNSVDRSVAALMVLLFMAVPLLLFLLVDSTLGRIHRKMGLS